MFEKIASVKQAIKEFTKNLLNDLKERVFVVKILNLMGVALYLDVETVGDVEGASYPFDVSFYIIILGVKITILKKQCFVISDIFDNPMLMTDVFSGADKIKELDDKTDYFYEGKDSHLYCKVSINKFVEIMNKLIDKYDIKYLIAYNATFDYKAVNNLYFLSNATENKFKDLNIIDTKILFCGLLKYSEKWRKKYIKWCKKHNKITPKGYASTKAEHVYQFLFSLLSFIEKHLGLDDVDIELRIYKKIMSIISKELKDMSYNINDLTTLNNCAELYTNKNALLKVE